MQSLIPFLVTTQNIKLNMAVFIISSFDLTNDSKRGRLNKVNDIYHIF